MKERSCMHRSPAFFVWPRRRTRPGPRPPPHPVACGGVPRRRPGRPPRLWIVTAGAVAARPGEAGDPGLGALRGLIRVLALERPGLRATLVDLDTAGGPRSAAATLAAELIADAPDDEVA